MTRHGECNWCYLRILRLDVLVSCEPPWSIVLTDLHCRVICNLISHVRVLNWCHERILFFCDRSWYVVFRLPLCKNDSAWWMQLMLPADFTFGCPCFMRTAMIDCTYRFTWPCFMQPRISCVCLRNWCYLSDWRGETGQARRRWCARAKALWEVASTALARAKTPSWVASTVRYLRDLRKFGLVQVYNLVPYRFLGRDYGKRGPIEELQLCCCKFFGARLR